MRKTTDQIKEDWLEDVEYGTLAPTIEVFDDEEFKEKLAEYNDAQSIKEMSVTRGWLVLKRLLIEEAERRMQDLIRCDEDDDEKLKKGKKEIKVNSNLVQKEEKDCEDYEGSYFSLLLSD